MAVRFLKRAWEIVVGLSSGALMLVGIIVVVIIVATIGASFYPSSSSGGEGDACHDIAFETSRDPCRLGEAP